MRRIYTKHYQGSKKRQIINGMHCNDPHEIMDNLCASKPARFIAGRKEHYRYVDRIYEGGQKNNRSITLIHLISGLIRGSTDSYYAEHLIVCIFSLTCKYNDILYTLYFILIEQPGSVSFKTLGIAE